MGIVKYGLLLGVGVAGYYGYKYLQNASGQFNFEVTGYGKPALQNYELTVPIQVKFTNPTPVPINIDRLISDIYVLKNGKWTLAAKIAQAASIKSGVSAEWINPKIQLQSLFGGSIVDTASFIQQLYSTRKLKIRTDVTAVYGALSLPKQSIEQEVTI